MVQTGQERTLRLLQIKHINITSHGRKKNGWPYDKASRFYKII